MSETKTAAEMLAQYAEAMGPELGELFNAASNELSSINWRWNQYRTLFGQVPSHIDLLNEAAPFFFLIVQDVLFEDTVLAIARIMSPPKSSGKSNLTITRFPELVTDSHLRVRLSELVEAAQKSAEFARDWRHRYLAHRDLSLAIKHPNVQPLAPVTREQVEQALSALRDVLDCIEEKYCNAHTTYLTCPVPGDARQLLHIIQSGLLRERDRRASWDRGERHADDINPPPPD
jgi:hypothetical protein